LFFARDDKYIDHVVLFLRNEDMELETEDDVAGFYGSTSIVRKMERSL